MTAASSTSPAPVATPGDDLMLLLREVTRGLRAAVDARLEPMGLSQAQWRPLLALHKADGPLTQTELARVLEIEAPSVVRLLDRLSEKHYIERRSAPGDRRIRQVFLTPQAHALIQQIIPAVHEARDAAFADLAAAEVAACVAALEKVRERLRNVAPAS
jgi:MarR family transcriptional regulator for hemolysin